MSVTTRRVIDAHVHVWSVDAKRYPWRPLGLSAPEPVRETSVESLLAAMDEAGVGRSVLVQPSGYGYDHSYLRAAVAVAPERFIAVGLVDPLAPNVASRLALLADTLPLRGIRLRLLGECGPLGHDTATASELIESALERNLVVSVLTNPDGLGVVATLARRHPRLRLVVDHLGSPARGRLADQTYRQRLLELAAHPNVYIKVSGFYAFSDEAFPHLDCHSLIEDVVAAFGTSRLVWGSDYPFVLNDCPYASSVGQLDLLLPGLPQGDRSQLLHDTAHRLWW